MSDIGKLSQIALLLRGRANEATSRKPARTDQHIERRSGRRVDRTTDIAKKGDSVRKRLPRHGSN
jgi:hypothetical protein